MVGIMGQQSVSLESFLQNSYTDVEKKINEIIDDQNVLLILKGGKRLRPLLASVSFKTCTGGTETDSLYQKFLEGSVAIELAHGASLVHDDIIDGDMNRRGEPAFYIRKGIDNAILIGHKMLVIGFNISLSHGGKIPKLYVDAWKNTLDGQLNEVNFNTRDLNNGSITVDSKFFQIYSRIIDLKTATLFASACKAAAIWANASDELADVLNQYGREVGFAYQLADDLVDLEKGEMIDSVVIPLLSRLEKKAIKNGSYKAKMVKKKLEENSDEIKSLYIGEIKKHIDHAKELSHHRLVPINDYTPLLVNVAPYLINKMLAEINIKI